MNELREASVSCPYCAEVITVLIDCSLSEQEYIEDCQVCCRPINFQVLVDPEGEINISVQHENE